MSRFEPHPDQRPTVVTGTSSGIGTEAARALADAGLPVVLGARRLDVCEDVAAEIRQCGGRAVAFPLDLADAASIDAFAKAAIEPFGPIEVVVSNAAAIRPGERCPTPAGRPARMGRLATARRAAKRRSRTSSGSTCSARIDSSPGSGRA